MNNKQFEQWLETHFPGRKYTQEKLAAFLSIYDQLAKELNLAPVKLYTPMKTAFSWLHTGRKVPKHILAILPQIEARAALPVNLHHFSVPIALNDAELAALQSTAARACSTPADFLRQCLQIGFEDQCGIE